MLQSIRRYRIIAGAIWITTVVCSLLWNYSDHLREKNTFALETARTFLTHLSAICTWSAEQGGVYVYTNGKNPANPYLPEDQQTITSNDGRLLTRVNPACMIRQIYEIVAQQSRLGFHLTSLDPMRPENKALDWEVQWLRDFEQGTKEKGAFFSTAEGEVFRYMAPVHVAKVCLPCHQGYQEGEMLGGVSISLPLAFQGSIWPMLISHGVAAILGLLGIHFFASRLQVRSDQLLATNERLQQEIEKHRQSEQELVRIKEELESRVAGRTAELSRANTLLDAKVKEQQQVERALVASNDELAQIFNSAPDGVQIIDRHFNVMRVNQAFMTLIRQSGGRIVGEKCFEVFSGALCNTPDCPLVRILGGEERVEVESRKQRLDGGSFPCLVTATPFFAPNGELIGIVEVTRDISSWKDAERALSQAANNLLSRNQELQDFSHVISHDLQEPLMLIQAFGQRLRTNFQASLPEKAVAYLERIINSAERMQMLINGLLSYSRVEKDAQPFTEVKLNQVVQAVLEDLALKIEESGAVITVDDLGVIVADPLQLRQLFQNLVGNSLKYHDPHQVPEITIARVAVPRGVDPHSHLSISIKDNGLGFGQEHQEKIFDIFQRLHTRQQFPGMGIGLSICKKIVERHHGVISATAVPGEGAEFVVTLPLIQERRRKLRL